MTFVVLISFALWCYLLAGRGRFWRSSPELVPQAPARTPPVAIVVPARDEAATIGAALNSLLAQDYAGDWRVILVDDGSTDATGAIARALHDPRLTVLAGADRPDGWSGKLWAVAQGIAEAGASPALFLLTDADIVHDPRHLATLVAQVERRDLDLASEMVALACDSPAERTLVPAFVYFFQLLYPFALVNDSQSATAAAAGGTILIRRRALDRIGGIAAVREALIDDVALATAVKRGGRIWLGHTLLARSIRPYPHPIDIWRMIARTAYVQLRHSLALLALTVLGMAVIFLAPPYAAIWSHGVARLLGLLVWAAMAASFVPTLRRYRRTPLWGIALPVIATFYLAATLASAWNHIAGGGVAWKGRAYRGATP